MTEEKRKKKKRKRLSPFGHLLLRIALSISAFVILHTWFFDLVRISGNQNYPSLRDGDLCLLYKREEYHTGDLVQYTCNNKKYVGRILCKEGTFDIQNNLPYVNGYLLSENSVYETVPGSYPLPVQLKEGQYLIVNDFRSDIEDSRNLGPVDQNDLNGKVMFLFRRRGF